MAARKTAATPSAFDFAAVAVEEVSELEKIKKQSAFNPLLSKLEESRDSGKTLKMTIPDEAVEDAKKYLRSAAKTLDVGLKTRVKALGDGSTVLQFEAGEKIQRRYTVEDVRDWAETNGYGDPDLYPSVGVHVIDAYREAHNLPAIKRDR